MKIKLTFFSIYKPKIKGKNNSGRKQNRQLSQIKNDDKVVAANPCRSSTREEENRQLDFFKTIFYLTSGPQKARSEQIGKDTPFMRPLPMLVCCTNIVYHTLKGRKHW